MRTSRATHQNQISDREAPALRPLERPNRDWPVACGLDVVQEGGGGVFECGFDGGDERIPCGKRVDVEDDVGFCVFDTPYHARSS